MINARGAAGDVPVVAVVGGGITGLAAAWRLLTAPGRRRVVLLEQSPRTGGLLHRRQLPGLDDARAVLDDGAEAFLARRPEALDLVAELGLAGDLVHPAATRAAVASRGALHPMPPGTVMGVPTRAGVARLAGLLTEAEVTRVAGEPAVSPPVDGDDVPLGELVAARLGDAVVDRLVEPLLGGVYAGHARQLSLRATVPALWPAARDGRPLLDAIPAPPTAGGAPGPVFGGLRGGVARLAETLHTRLLDGGAQVRTSTVVHALQALPGRSPRWRLRVGAAWSHEVLDADAVVLAVPPGRAARLLAGVAPVAGEALAAVETASVAVVAVVLPAGTLDALAPRGLSGVLVPPAEGRFVKAMTFSSRKWAWVGSVAGGRDVVRLSVGRVGQERDLQRDDDDLVAAALADAGAVLGGELRALGTSLTRWGGALPQYAPGHPTLVARAMAAMDDAPGLALAGAAYGGVGVPACLASAQRAAAEVLTATAAQAGQAAPVALRGSAGTRDSGAGRMRP